MEPKGAHQAKTFHVDHIQELQIGGENSIENMWLLEGDTNIKSGAQIRGNIQKQVRKFLKAAEPTLQEPPTYEQVREKYTVTWKDVKKNGGKRPSDAKYWEKTEIEQGAHQAARGADQPEAQGLTGQPRGVQLARRRLGPYSRRARTTRRAAGTTG